MLSGLLALISASAFAGAAVYINIAEHPARMTIDAGAMLAEWRVSYSRGFAMQASLAVVSAVFGLLAFWQTSEMRWFVGAALIFANWTITLLVILPINNRLLAIPPDEAGAESRRLLDVWQRLHGGRSVLGVLATIAYVWALV